ncbi:MAG: DegV family protein [Firmicutes bacterium]|nr:DegV family protein [Bacillota bacterium]
MNIKITADSTCDLSPEILEAYNITLVPLTVIMDGKDYKDGVTITPAQIFAHVASGGALCSTSAVSVGEYQEVFSQYAEEYDGVLHVTISADFSSTYNNACLAAQEFDNVRVVDSRNLSTGQGLVVLKACELAKTAASMDELKQALDAFTSKVEASFLVDKLDYLVKGGRCSSAAALGANLLNLKPCIEVKDGKMVVVKKYRGKYAKCLANYVKDRLDGREDLDLGTLFVTHTTVSDECHDAVMEAVKTYGKFDKIYETLAGCTVSCHCGPDTLGILFVRK